ncbi:hypothetical protein [Bacillus sp. C1]
MKRFDKEFVKVELVTNCYRRKCKGEQIFDTEKWKKVKAQRYYMG